LITAVSTVWEAQADLSDYSELAVVDADVDDTPSLDRRMQLTQVGARAKTPIDAKFNSTPWSFSASPQAERGHHGRTGQWYFGVDPRRR
jgi:hypothetical protein